MPSTPFIWQLASEKNHQHTSLQHPVALYVHWPFCLSKCPYCDFNSHVTEAIDEERWRDAYIKELESFAPLLSGRIVSSVFFGGGTPSLMPPSIVSALLGHVQRLGGILSPELEVTLEANPTSAEAEKFVRFRESGVNRVSLGIQSLREKDLHFLGRKHNAEEARNAIRLAQSTFPRYSFDLIYARPGQTIASWKEELQEALDMAGEHLSLYQLTIEKGTPFYQAYKKQQFLLPEEEEAAALYEATQEWMEQAGLPFYEVSNYARPGAECRHNLTYWHYEDYIGIGPGAHSRVSYNHNKYAIMMVHAPERWLHAVEAEGSGQQLYENIPVTAQREEMLMMGLRLRSGITHERFQQAYGQPFKTAFSEQYIHPLLEEKLLQQDEAGIRVTEKGFPVLNGIIHRLIAGGNYTSHK